jgi:hypothetical protein
MGVSADPPATDASPPPNQSTNLNPSAALHLSTVARRHLRLRSRRYRRAHDSLDLGPSDPPAGGLEIASSDRRPSR